MTREPVDPVPIWDLRPHHCRWVIGDPRDAFGHRYCGEPKLPERAYCHEHYERSVVHAPPRKRASAPLPPRP